MGQGKENRTRKKSFDFTQDNNPSSHHWRDFGRARHGSQPKFPGVCKDGCYIMVKMKPKYWSAEVTENSVALDLEEGVFTWSDPKQIALSLKKSAENSTRRKASPFQSAMSMLNFYVNRAGRNLLPERKKILEQAKVDLRKIFRKRYTIK